LKINTAPVLRSDIERLDNMNRKIIAYDLGTGGNKASLYDSDGSCLSTVFIPYDTHYPRTGWHEQRPMDWWDSVVSSTRKLLGQNTMDPEDIECVSISGHSLGVVPLDKKGNLIREMTPIWSDTRAENQVKEFFKNADRDKWYMTTGNGFPPACYSAFKIMWYRDNEPDMYKRVFKIIGTKDFVNFKMTGKVKTDYSYASGCGVYDLKNWSYSPVLMKAAMIPSEILPDIVPSTEIIGELTKEASETLGLPRNVRVICGGVDNSCMALGARNIREGRVYTSLGSSAWIAVSSKNPILDPVKRPFVFTHVIPGMFTSAVSIFSAGNSLKWVRDNLCLNLKEEASQKGIDVYELMGELAGQAPVGSNKLLFDPSLAGGSSQDPSPHIRGGFSGLDLGHGQPDVIRSCMEGVAMNLGLVLDVLRKFCDLSEEMMMVGGGSKSRTWRQIFADVYNMNIIKTNIGEDAGSLGAAALGAVGSGMWKDFNHIDDVHKTVETVRPLKSDVEKYRRIRKIFECLRNSYQEIGDLLHKTGLS
jgi:xylulokinase